jgi:PII-like signaling protein
MFSFLSNANINSASSAVTAIVTCSEGFGHDKKLHSVHFFELTEQPLQVTMAVTAEEAELMFM